MAYKTKVPYRFTSMLLFFLDYIFLTVIPLMQVASAIPPFFWIYGRRGCMYKLQVFFTILFFFSELHVHVSDLEIIITNFSHDFMT